MNLIVSGQLPPAALPPEASLLALFGVSRILIREALKSIEARGMVSIRQGQDTVVTERGSWDLLDRVVLDALIEHDDTGQVLDQLVGVRASLEAMMAHSASHHARPADHAHLASIVERMNAAGGDADRFASLDLKFHDAVMTLSRNEVAAPW